MVLIFEPEVNFDVDHLPQSDDLHLPGEERLSDSPFVECIWRSHSDDDKSFTSTAVSNWEIVVTKSQGNTTLTIRGPETQATPAYCPPDAEFMGIVFKVGTFMPKFPASMIIDRNDRDLPQAGSHSFWLDSCAWEFPNFENADTFIHHLVCEGLIVQDPIVDVVLQEQPTSMSRRTIQRRFLQATGLTYNQMFQIERARHATDLLEQGVSILDAVEQTGYADQPHLTRALRRFMGQTPGQISSWNIDKPMSFLFKTSPF